MEREFRSTGFFSKYRLESCILSRQSSGDFDVARAGWIGDYEDPKSFLDMMVTGRGNNQTGWSNKAYDDFLIKAANSSSQDQRFAYMYQAEEILMDELPIIPVYTYTRIYMLHNTIKGWSPNMLTVTLINM